MHILAEFRPVSSIDEKYFHIIKKMNDCEELNTDILSGDEVKKYNRMLRLKRKREFLSGRYVAKQLVSKVENIEVEKIMILNEKDGEYMGKPVLYLNNERAKYDISISHDSSTIAAAIGEKSIGIDVLRCRENLKKYNEDGPLLNNADWNEDIYYNLVWSMKEAFTKAIGIGLVYGIDSVVVNDVNTETSAVEIIVNECVEKYLENCSKIVFYYEIMQDTVCVICQVVNSNGA